MYRTKHVPKNKSGRWIRFLMLPFETDSLRRAFRFFGWFRLAFWILLLSLQYRVDDGTSFYLLLPFVLAILVSSFFVYQSQISNIKISKIMFQALWFDILFAFLVNLHIFGDIYWSGVLGLFYLTLVNAALFGRHRGVLLFFALCWLGTTLSAGGAFPWESRLFFAGLHGVLLLSLSITLGWLVRRMVWQEMRAQRSSSRNTFLNTVNERILKQSLDGFLAIDNKGFVHSTNPRCAHWLEVDRLGGFSLSTNERTIALGRAISADSMNSRLYLAATPQQPEISLSIRSMGKAQINQTKLSLFVLRDVVQDEQRLHEDKLAALGRFTAGVSHQIRNPIAAIMQAKDLLSSSKLDDAQQKKMIDLIGRNAERINTLVSHILSSFRLRPPSSFIELNTLVSKAIAIFSSSCPEGVSSLYCGPIPFCLVRFENTSFTEIVCNLLDNAFSHSQKKSESVKIDFLVRQGWVSLIIRDDGAGVPEEHREKIFEPFFTTRNQGIGLGLFVARELAHAQGAILFYRRDQFGHSLVLDMKTS